MKKSKTITVAVLIFLLWGCNDFFMVCSINPYYIEKNIVLDPTLEGTWLSSPVNPVNASNDKSVVWKEADTTLTWKIERYISRDVYKDRFGKDSVSIKPQNYYMVKLQPPGSDSASYQFKMVLFKIKGNIYADFMPVTNFAMEHSRMVKENFLLMHTLARINTEGKSHIFSWLSEQTMKEMIESKHVRARYLYSRSVERLMLTGSSDQLTEMIERHASEKRFISWDEQPAIMKINPVN
jgi:hypothetical protein